jgi:hypothetical protein
MPVYTVYIVPSIQNTFQVPFRCKQVERGMSPAAIQKEIAQQIGISLYI